MRVDKTETPDFGAIPVCRQPLANAYPQALAHGAEDAAPYRGIVDPQSGETDIEQTARLIEQIAIRMDGSSWTGPGDDSFNHAIPCGYTYLAQFAAHDMTLNSRPVMELFSAAAGENLRSRALMLDTLYGGGPQALPHCHAQPDDPTETPVKLRLEAVRVGSRKGPLRDIGRLIENTGGRLRCIPLVADARNDDNAVVSQITALFAQVHNAATAKMPANWKAEERYLGARLAVTSAFRSILRRDLVRRIVDPATYNWYDNQAGEDRFLARATKGRPVSAEFAHAVWRMGHAMVRPEYKFNMRSESHPLGTVIERSSLKRPREMPFDREWIAQWSLFFDLGKRKPQPSMLIGPSFSGPLNQAFKDPKGTDGSGLARRDLIRGVKSGVASLAHLRGRITATASPDFPNRSWLVNAQRHRAIVEAWLETSSVQIGAGDGYGKLPKAHAQALINDPPLGLFILIEASQKPWSGRCLGPLGSLIAAETFFRAFDDDSSLDTLVPRPGFGAAEAVRAVFGPTPETMPALIRWLDRHMPDADKRLPDGRPLPLI